MIYKLLKEQMSRFADSTVRDESDCMTYRELLERSECLGKTLDRHKYGILCRSELHTAVAALACLYANRTGVLLSYRYGDKHNEKIIKKMKVSYLITDAEVKAISQEEPEVEDLSDVAFIMSTSGTTGSPKGAMITYHNLLANLQGIMQYFVIGDTDTILIARPLYHCAVLTGEFLVSLLNGTDILFLNGAFSPAGILKAVKQYGVTVLCGTPTILYYLCGIIRRRPQKLPLKTIAVSGECMTQTVADCLCETLPSVAVYHVYGLTEASPRVSYLPPGLFNKYPLSVGWPLDMVKARIEDGELLVAGENVMKGYYDDPEATGKAMADGWLHTGDMAEMDRQGLITIKSRKDNMIIRAGMNIYPQEIENTLRGAPGILDVLAHGTKDAAVGQKIYLKVQADALSKAQIYAYCRDLLPSYQMPDMIEIVDEIPRNASGKVIRRSSGSVC